MDKNIIYTLSIFDAYKHYAYRLSSQIFKQEQLSNQAALLEHSRWPWSVSRFALSVTTVHQTAC